MEKAEDDQKKDVREARLGWQGGWDINRRDLPRDILAKVLSVVGKDRFYVGATENVKRRVTGWPRRPGWWEACVGHRATYPLGAMTVVGMAPNGVKAKVLETGIINMCLNIYGTGGKVCANKAADSRGISKSAGIIFIYVITFPYPKNNNINKAKTYMHTQTNTS